MQNKFRHLLLGLALFLPAAAANVTRDAERIAQEYLIVDTHIDVPYRITRRPDDVSQATRRGEFDYPRAQRGGLNAPFMSIYIPALVDAQGNAFQFAVKSIDYIERLAKEHPDKFAVATCSDDIAAQAKLGLISLPMGMENGGPISGEIANADYFFQRGIRYITLAHSKSNHLSDSSYDPDERWQGLSPFGQELVPEMNRLGIMVDVSHISDKAFWQVLALSKVPVIASHSSMRHFTPNFHRNMSDDMLKAMAAKGGVIQINYGSSFITKAARDWSIKRTADLTAYAEANNLTPEDEAFKAYAEAYREQNPYPFADLDSVLDHIDRAVEIAGIDAVGIGSDYDGVGDSLPTGLKDVASYPNLIAGLLKRGYSEADIAKILGGNTLRVWRANERFARSQGVATQCQTATPRQHQDDTVAAPTTAEDEFHFVVLGDAQFHRPSHFNRVIDQARALDPAFVVQVGDLIQGYNSDLGEIEAEWQRFKRQIAPLSPIPYYPVPGNHDVYGGNKLPDANLEEIYRQQFGPLYFSFRYKNSLFIGLNSDPVGSPGEIDEAQIDWLTEKLRTTSAENKFVFMHKPPLLMDKAERLHKIFAAFGVQQVMYGHHHHYHHIEQDGVAYTMTNASGTMGQAQRNIGGFFHLLLVSVRGNDINVAVIDADAVQGQDIVAPIDNYDTYAIKRRLVPREVELEPLSENQYGMTLPINNATERAIDVYISCDSEDNRWQFNPVQIEKQRLRAGRSKNLSLTASFDANRQPESDPVCTLVVPLSTSKGDWSTIEVKVTGKRG